MKNKNLKKLIRERMKRTGESYSIARMHILGRPAPTISEDAFVEMMLNLSDAKDGRDSADHWYDLAHSYGALVDCYCGIDIIDAPRLVELMDQRYKFTDTQRSQFSAVAHSIDAGHMTCIDHDIHDDDDGDDHDPNIDDGDDDYDDPNFDDFWTVMHETDGGALEDFFIS